MDHMADVKDEVLAEKKVLRMHRRGMFMHVAKVVLPGFH